MIYLSRTFTWSGITPCNLHPFSLIYMIEFWYLFLVYFISSHTRTHQRTRLLRPPLLNYLYDYIQPHNYPHAYLEFADKKTPACSSSRVQDLMPNSIKLFQVKNQINHKSKHNYLETFSGHIWDFKNSIQLQFP